MCATGYCSALHGIPSGNLFWKPWTMKGKTSQLKKAIYIPYFIYHQLYVVSDIGSSNQSALFIY